MKSTKSKVPVKSAPKKPAPVKKAAAKPVAKTPAQKAPPVKDVDPAEIRKGDTVHVNFGTPKNYLKNVTVTSVDAKTYDIEVPTNGKAAHPLKGIDKKFVFKSE